MVSVRKSWEVRRFFYYTKVMVSFGKICENRLKRATKQNGITGKGLSIEIQSDRNQKGDFGE